MRCVAGAFHEQFPVAFAQFQFRWHRENRHRLGSVTVPCDGIIAVVVLLEINALMGKQGPMASVKGVIHCSIGLLVVLGLILHYL